jgi:DNA replication protein DnaC
MFKNYIPPCDDCGEILNETFKISQEREKWNRYFNEHLPNGYRSATPAMVSPHFASALEWRAAIKHGGLGLVGPSGAGKSSAITCLLYRLKLPFLWWSGTEARDAATEAATADRDREGARRRWDLAARIPILVLDDISQGRMTEAWSAKLFDLLETRMGGGLPTLWTSQISLPDLRAKIARQNGGDTEQADAISRRLAQHSLTLKASNQS